MKIMFQIWWKSETNKDRTKLDFYFSIKKNFGYEKYLDIEDRNARIATSKLRLSCHCLPIEVLRYYGTDRIDRTCNICSQNKIGDEKHYLTECGNQGMADIRTKLISDIKETCPQMTNFSIQNIMTYCVSMSDEKIHVITSKFISNLLKQYKKEDSVPPLRIMCLRYMGKIRKPHLRRTKLKQKVGK